MNRIEGINQTPKLNFSIGDTTEVMCQECKYQVFQNGIVFRKVSKLLAGTDKDGLVPITVPYCVNCLEPIQELLPPELRKHKIQSIIP